jgi:hypothetical protein
MGSGMFLLPLLVGLGIPGAGAADMACRRCTVTADVLADSE